MELVLVIAQIVALLCLSALCVYMIVVLLRVRDILGNVERDIRDIATRRPAGVGQHGIHYRESQERH